MRQRVGGGAACGLRDFDLADQTAALLLENLRSIVEFRAFVASLLETRLQRVDLRRRTVLTLAPGDRVCSDRGDTALREFDLTNERLCFGPHLGELRSFVRHPAADFGELGFEPIGRGERGQCRGGFVVRGIGFREAGGEACLCFSKGGAASGDAVDLALGFGMTVTRRVRFALQFAPTIAGVRFRLGGCGDLRLRRCGRLTACLDLAAGDLQLGFDVEQSIALFEPAGGSGRRMCGNGESIPAPQIAVARDEPLAGLEQLGKTRAVVARDHADLGEPARQFSRGASDMRGERFDALRQCRIGRIRLAPRPMHRRARLDRRVEIVAQCGAERGFVSLFDAEQIDYRRPQILVVDVQHLGERLGLGLQAVVASLGFGERLAHDIECLAGAGMRRLGA